MTPQEYEIPSMSFLWRIETEDRGDSAKRRFLRNFKCSIAFLRRAPIILQQIQFTPRASLWLFPRHILHSGNRVSGARQHKEQVTQAVQITNESRRNWDCGDP